MSSSPKNEEKNLYKHMIENLWPANFSGLLRMVSQASKLSGEVSLHLKLDLNTLRFLCVLTHKSLTN